MKRILLVNEEAGVSVRASVAGRTGERMKGLIGKAPPASGQGLLLRGRQIHTFRMSYPIDVVHLSKSYKILRVESMKPRRIGHAVLSARFVLEMAEGHAGAAGLVPGMQLEPVEA